MKNLLVLMVLASGCGGWTKKDTIMELTYAASAAGDWAQTRGITAACAEENPMLGACGQNMSPALYFPATIVVHATIAAVLHGRARTAWQAVGTGLEINQLWRDGLKGYSFDGTGPNASAPPPVAPLPTATFSGAHASHL